MKLVLIAGLTLSACVSTQGILENTTPLKIVPQHNHITGDSIWYAESFWVIGGPLDSIEFPQIQVGAMVWKPSGGEMRRVIIFNSESRDWRFLQHRRVTMLVNGIDRLELGEAEQEGRVVAIGNVSVRERLYVPVTAEQMQRIATANAVEVQLGGAQFSLRPKTLHSFGQLNAVAATHQ